MMIKHSPFAQNFEDLPDSLPVFPLPNAVVLPGGHLPLNIFEPRYLQMVQDAMASHRLIGMIQPRDDSKQPRLYDVGCAGRITRYHETQDGRLEILLSGLCRFRMLEELSTTRDYRLVKPDWSEYEIDFIDAESTQIADKMQFDNALKAYLEHIEMQVDWDILEKLSNEELINSLVSALPLGDGDKQMLIEATTLENRLRAFTAILEGSGSVSAIKH